MISIIMKDAFDRYMDGIPPGNFMYAILTNNLTRAAQSADSDNASSLSDIAKFMVYYLPMPCYGSDKEVKEWLKLCQSTDDLDKQNVQQIRDAYTRYIEAMKEGDN